MKTAGAAGRYAKALFDLAEGPKQKEEFLSQLRALGQAFTDQEELRDVFENPQFDTALKKRIIDQLCAKVSASSMVRNTLCLLADRGRMRELPGMVEAFSELLEESEGRVRAEVITAVAMPENYFTELSRALETVTGKKVSLVRRQDPSILGGVVAKVGDQVFDGSLKNQLSELKEELLERS